VSGAIDLFLAAKRAAGLVDLTVATYNDRLQALLAPVLARPLRRLTGRGTELYLAVTAGRRPDTHRHCLTVGKMWGKWCVRQRLLRANPFSDVEPIGRRTQGADKARLTVDESRQLEVWCLAHAHDMGAALTLSYLYLGSRASELVRRDVRDLDDDGALLWIGRTKTAAGSRRLRIPPELGAMLLALVAGRAPDDPLFAHADGSRWSRSVAGKRVREACAAAVVPVLGPQALRRTQSTLATEAGETALAVARHLGHATGSAPAVTGRAYVGRDAAQNARNERAQRLIQGGGRLRSVEIDRETDPDSHSNPRRRKP
jgi:integrase